MYLKYVIIVFFCITQSCKFQKTDSKSTESGIIQASESKGDNDGFSFDNPVLIIKTCDAGMELANLKNGCLIEFDLKKRNIINPCFQNLISGNLPVYEIFKLNSTYVYTYGYEDNINTEVYNNNGKRDTLLKEYSVEGAKNETILLTKSDFLSSNLDIYSFNLKERELENLGISGDPIFGSTSKELIIAEINESGNTSVYKYFLQTNRKEKIFEFKGDLYLFGYNSNSVYFLGNSKQSVYEFRIIEREINLLLNVDDVKSAFYSHKNNRIVFVSNGNILYSYEIQ